MPSMGKPTTLVLPFTSKGLVQRVDPGMMEAGEYYSFLNMMTTQEGSVQSRLGSRNATASLSPAITSAVDTFVLHSMSRMRISSADTANPRYWGYSDEIRRTQPDASQNFITATDVALDATGANYLTADSRWQAAQFNAGQQGRPNIYFATPTHMMKDGQVGTTFSPKLQQWGVQRPTAPVLAFAGYGGDAATNLSVRAIWSNGAPSDTYPATRMRVIASAVTHLYTLGGYAGYWRIGYGTSIFAGIQTTYPVQDMYVETNLVGDGYMVVLKGDQANATFDVWWPYAAVQLVVGTTFYHEMRAPVTTASGVATASVPYATISSHDLSYSNKDYSSAVDSNEGNGFETDDSINLTLWINGAENVADVKLRFFLGPGTQDYGNDFYEKSIITNTAASLVQGAGTVSGTTALTAAQTRSQYIDTGVLGDRGLDLFPDPSARNDYPVDPTQSGLTPEELYPVQPNLGTIGTYHDLSWRKSEMLKVGRAGQPGYNWKNVTNAEVIFRAVSTGLVIIARVGNCWSRGGYGPDTSIPGAFPYDYVVAYRDPLTNHIGNPSVPMIQESFVQSARVGVGLYVRGIAPAVTGGPQLANYSASGSLVIFRRGGAFSDGLYRLCKSIPNPGDTYTLVPDTVPDYQLVTAQLAEFDNDQPVTSSLPEAFTATISGATASTITGAQYNSVTFSALTGIFSSVRRNSVMHVGVGDNAEDVIVQDANTLTSTITFYAQRTQDAIGVQLTVEAVAGQPCDLICQAMDSIFLAGDANNPHVLYKSKTGRPESWPVIGDINKASYQIPVGSPSNPINGIVEFNGEIVCLNLGCLYLVRIWQGTMQTPIEIPASKGCIAKRAFCKGDGRLYYVGVDGVYETTGSSQRKISEQIDWVFRDREVNGISPMSRLEVDLSRLVVFYQQNMLYVVYNTVTQGFRTARYDTVYERWHLDVLTDSAGNVLSYGAVDVETETGRLYAARTPAVSGQAIRVLDLWEQGTIGTTDGFSLSPGIDGDSIYFEAVTPFFTGGQPSVNKLFTEAVLEVENPSTALIVEALYDFATPPTAVGGPEAFTIAADQIYASVAVGSAVILYAAGQTFDSTLVGNRITVGNAGNTSFAVKTVVSVNAPGTIVADSTFAYGVSVGLGFLFRRRRIPLPLNQSTFNATTVANGREAYAVAFRITPATPQNPLFNCQTKLYSLTLNHIPMEQIQRGRITDWNDLGYPYDKQLDVLSIEYELPSNITTPVAIWMDIMSGISGNTTLSQGVALFQLGGSGGTLGANVRHKESINIQNVTTAGKIIAKTVRLRPVVQTLNILVFDWDIAYKKYPADIVNFTQADDNGSPYDKYFTQVILEVDTGSVAATAIIKIDGTAAQTLSVTSSEEDRMKIFTLRQGLLGKVYNLVFAAGSGGKFQLFNHKVITEPADKGPVIHSHDWDACGHPYDKRFHLVTFEYEVSADTSLIIEGLYGVYPGAGQTIAAVATLAVSNSAGTRRQVQYRFTDSSVYKMVRFRPATNEPTITAKIYRPEWQFEKLPPDIVPFTEPQNWGSPYLKYFQQLNLDVDTGGVGATVNAIIDGATVTGFTVTTTPFSRLVTLTMPGVITGRMGRVSATAGAGGKFQLFDHQYITLPADKGPVLHTFDWDDCGHPYDKHFYEMTVEADIAGTIAQAFLIAGITGAVGNQSTVTMGAVTFSGATGRMKLQFSFDNSTFSSTVAKLIRLYPDTSVTTLNRDTRIYKPEWQFEKYPPDVVRFTEYNEYGSPYTKYFQQILLDVDTGSGAAEIIVEIDGNASQTFASITTNAFSRKVNLTLQGNLFGRMARIKANPAGSPGAKFQLFKLDFITLPADKGPVSHTYDWDDLGHPYDKRMYQVVFEYEVDVQAVLLIQGVAGIDGAQTQASTIASLTLAATGAARKKQQYRFPDASVYKLIRLVPQTGSPTTSAKIYRPDWQFEKYPPDIVPFTETNDYGSPYLKYFQQLVLEVDTNNVAATVICEIDGTAAQTISVTTGPFNRNKTLTLDPLKMGRRARILATPGSGGKFQLFSGTYITLPADKGPVMHTFDWDDLGHPYDKRLKEVTIEFDTNNVTTTIWMDTLTGAGIQQTVTHANSSAPFVLSGSGRGLLTFPIPDGQLVKMVKLYPESTTVDFREWKYRFDFERMPADTALFTEWTNLDYHCEKIIRAVIMDIDTGGIPASVELQADGQTKYTFSVNGDTLNRSSIITVPSDIIGKMFRFKITPGSGGKAQLFSHSFERVLEPCYLTHWDSYEQSFGSNGYKFIKQIWIEYICLAELTFSIYRDNGELFYQKTLPVHPHRDVERFYLPKSAMQSGDARYNKSKMYRFVLDSTNNAFKFYRDASRIETRNLSQDQREGYLQSYLFSQMPIPV